MYGPSVHALVLQIFIMIRLELVLEDLAAHQVEGRVSRLEVQACPHPLLTWRNYWLLFHLPLDRRSRKYLLLSLLLDMLMLFEIGDDHTQSVVVVL